MAPALSAAHPHSIDGGDLEGKLQYLLAEELCGLDTAAMILGAPDPTLEDGFDETGEEHVSLVHDADGTQGALL
ncbi:MAG: hypothetical protein WAU70_01170 [Flavobacteriales bacterium]